MAERAGADPASWNSLIEPLRIVPGQRDLVALWMLERLPDVTDLPGGYEALGVARGLELVGGVIYSDYRPCKGGGQIQMWCAGHNWLSRRVLREVFGYPLNERPRGLGCHRINALVARGNKPVRRMCNALGFTEEGKLRRGYDTQQDLIVYGLLRSECKWI